MRSLLCLLLFPCAALFAYQPASDHSGFLLGNQDQLSLEQVPLAAAPEPEADQEPASLFSQVRGRAENGDLDAEAQLGVMYYWGQDAPLDYGKAMFWLHRAADAGQRDAQAKLGAMYFLGQGTAADEAEAIHWFRKAAEQGEPYSQGCIGLMYIVGHGVPQDLPTAFFWLYQAAAGGDQDAAAPLKAVKTRLSVEQLEDGVRRAEAAIHGRAQR
jgi:TPR repeat protein